MCFSKLKPKIANKVKLFFAGQKVYKFVHLIDLFFL